MLRYFSYSEFDSPDKPGTGKLMDKVFLQKLDKAREIAKIPFIITSGFRTREYNSTLERSVPNSSHIYGKAVDISAVTDNEKDIIIKSLIEVGFKRIGIAGKAIHVDNDYTKPYPSVWFYDNTDQKYRDNKSFYISEIKKMIQFNIEIIIAILLILIGILSLYNAFK